MEQSTAFQALGHPTRLAAFRLLVQAGPTGLLAGEIATRLTLLPNTLSSHLATLSAAHLITATRQGRTQVYTARMDTLRALTAWLVQDCCGGNPDLCAPPNP